MYATYLKLSAPDQFGRQEIEEVVRVPRWSEIRDRSAPGGVRRVSNETPYHPVECQQKELQGVLIRDGGNRHYYRHGEILEKPVVKVEVVAPADLGNQGLRRARPGEAVEIRVTGLPEEYESVDLVVGGQPVQIGRTQTLSVVWETPATVEIGVVDRFLRSQPAYLRFA